ncbi:MAG: SusC/RagA family TonB-linked outer membrane protein [Dysgonamonadaceae bacterium]|jgi:TonB-linked SusC/RagA family outer membrane protein|nr:SusC/RagA family TonB-linked outer membrane protein [Dysgonamonadaceae bacterium]
MSNVTVKEAMDQLKKTSGYSFVFSSIDVNTRNRISISVKNATIDAVVKQILQGQEGLSYEIKDKNIIVKKVQPPVSPAKKITATGKVIDSSGYPIDGVTVLEKGTQNGTFTDRDGNFSLNTTDNAILSFSFIGFTKQEINAATEMKISLKENVEMLEDVVITGYMNIDKGSYVGAISTVKVDEIKVAGESSIDYMLQGVVPGMSVLMSSGQVGATPKIRIRGTSTILGNQEPVWVVDGIIQLDPLPIPNDMGSLASDLTELREIASNAISWLNPNDIESLTVLKDASATAIYGSKAANGVIVITTKKARPGHTSVSYNGSFTIGQKPVYGMYDMMNSQELMQYAHEIYRERSRYTSDVLPIGYASLMYRLESKQIDNATFAAEYAKMESQNTDWFDLLFRNNFSQNHNISIGGGNENITNRTSFGINKQHGEAIGNNSSAYSATSNSTIKLGDRLTINLLLKGSINETSGFAYGVNPFNYAYNTARTVPMYDDDGNLFYHEKSGQTSTVISSKYTYLYNIQNEINNTGNNNSTKNLDATIDLRLKLSDKLEYQGVYAYATSSSQIKSYATELSHYITQIRGYEYETVLPNSTQELASRLPYGGLVSIEGASNNSFTLRNSLVYNNKINDIHRLTVQLGSEIRSTLTEGSTVLRYGYLRYRGESFAPVPEKPAMLTNTSAMSLHEAMRSNSSIVNQENNYVSEYFSAIYGYDERYVLNFNARLDASNRFGQDKNKLFQPAWSAGVKWRVGNEHFFDNSGWISSFDLSASYGYQGNAVETVSPYLIAIDGGLSSFVKQYTLNIKSLPYPDLGWEKTNSWNLSLDFGFLDNRLNAIFNLYRKTSDVLASRDVPVENGMNNAIVMGSKMINRGYDLVVSLIPVKTRDFTWQFSVNTGIARNTLENNNRVNVLDDYLTGNAIVNGEAYSSFWSYAYDKLDPENGRPLFKYMDIDPTENDLDYLVYSGKLQPDFSGGLQNQLRYKRWALNMQFAISMGGQKRLPTFYNIRGAHTPEQNVPRIIMNRWKQPGDELYTNIPSIPDGNLNNLYIYLPNLINTFISPYEMYNKSDLRVADSDFIRCRQISLTYSVPPKWLARIHLADLRASLSMANPFLIAFDKEWRGYDPETGGWPARRSTSLSLSASF